MKASQGALPRSLSLRRSLHSGSPCLLCAARTHPTQVCLWPLHLFKCHLLRAGLPDHSLSPAPCGNDRLPPFPSEHLAHDSNMPDHKCYGNRGVSLSLFPPHSRTIPRTQRAPDTYRKKRNPKHFFMSIYFITSLLQVFMKLEGNSNNT